MVHLTRTLSVWVGLSLIVALVLAIGGMPLVEALPPDGSLVALRVHNGQFMVAEGGGGGEVLANRDWIGTWETFELSIVNADANQIALRVYNGQFMVAEGGGGGEVLANRDAIGEWETFELIELVGNRVALRAYNGQYVVAEGGGGREVLANRDAIGEWETFELTVIDLSQIPSRIALRADNGQYVVAEDDGKVLANGDMIEPASTFDLEFVDTRERTIALRADSGQYLTVETRGDHRVLATSNTVSENETFGLLLIDVEPELPLLIALRARATGGDFVTAVNGGGGAVLANQTGVGPSETFQLIDRSSSQPPTGCSGDECVYLNAVSQGEFQPKYDLTPRDEPEFDPNDRNNGYRNTYYGKVDPQGMRTTLGDWRTLHRFDDFPLSMIHATFINTGDLDPGLTGGLGRDMFCLNDGRAFPCYVQNYLDPRGVNGPPDQIGRDLVATVAMERMTFTEGVHDREIVAFFVFDKDGKRVNRIALDSEGEKSVPELCYGCHMGRTDRFGTDRNGNFTVGLGVPAGGHYLPFDVDTFDRWPGQPSLTDQADEFRRLNEHVRSAAENRKESIQNLILGWYGREPGDFLRIDDIYNGRFIPDEWFTDPQGFEVPGSPAFDLYFRERSLYANVYSHYCRNCHIVQGEAQNNYPTRGLDWKKASEFCPQAKAVVCSDPFEPRMPHAEHTFDRFVNDVLNFTDGTSSTPQLVLCAQECPQAPTPNNGAALYATHCQRCHGALAVSSKRGRSAAQISTAIQNVSQMSFLGGILNNAQIQAIANALAE